MEKIIKSRIYEVVQQKNYLTKEMVEEGVNHKLICKYAYVLHDKDNYTEYDYQKYLENHKDEKDETKKIPVWKIGDKKPDHWHVVIQLKKDYELDKVAKWFGVLPNYVQKKKGRGAFIDCVRYITHEDEKQQEIGKHLYQDDEITANFDFREEIDYISVRTNLSPKTIPSSKLDKWLYEIAHDGKTLSECYKEDTLLYSKYASKFEKARSIYPSNCPPPPSRVNIYISGQGGIGKGLASRAIARQFARTYEGMEGLGDEDLFFVVGSDGSSFEGYDGQPVIIWNDCRSFELFKKLGSREAIYNVFDTHPTKQRQNIKYSSTALINKINIINSVQEPDEFINGLAGEYTDKHGEKHKAEDINQVKRRIVITITLHDDYFETQFNKGYFEDLNDYSEYYDYKKMCGNFHRVATLNKTLCRQVEEKMTHEITDKIIDKMNSELYKDDSDILPKEFETYGTPYEFMDIPDGIDKVQD